MSQHETLSRRAFMTLEPKPASLTHIASLLVQAKPDALDSVRTLIRAWPDSEVHDTPDPRKLAVVLEAASDRAIGDAVAAIQALSGVLSVSIVAHLAESEEMLRQEHRHG